MGAPVANFSFNANGLSVNFTDGSSGIVTSWAWDFGFQVDSVEQTSNVQNPGPIVFPQNGIYTVTLTSSNNQGSNTFTFPLVVTSTPNTNLTIQEVVQYDLPVGIAFNSIGFQQAIRKWMVYLMCAAEIPTTASNPFDESIWPTLYKILITKLIIYELVQKAALASMTAYIAAAESYNELASLTVGGSMQVGDYTIAFTQSYPLTVNLIIANGVNYGPSSALADLPSTLAYLNGLGIGIFAVSGGNLVSLGNVNILTTFNYTPESGGINGAFTQENLRVIPYFETPAPSPNDGAIGAKGALKHLEAGPSKAQWYDSSTYWFNMFRTPKSNGSDGGLMTSLAQEICVYAGRLTVQLPMCPKQKTHVHVPQIAHPRFGDGAYCGGYPFLPYYGMPPVSNERASYWFYLYYYGWPWIW